MKIYFYTKLFNHYTMAAKARKEVVLEFKLSLEMYE
jgi:hypothetical protein